MSRLRWVYWFVFPLAMVLADFLALLAGRRGPLGFYSVSTVLQAFIFGLILGIPVPLLARMRNGAFWALLYSFLIAFIPDLVFAMFSIGYVDLSTTLVALALWTLLAGVLSLFAYRWLDARQEKA